MWLFRKAFISFLVAYNLTFTFHQNKKRTVNTKLFFAVKSPSAPPFAMEHMPPIQLSPDIPKTIFIPRKSPEEFEKTIVLKQKLPDLSTLEIPADLLQPNVKLETEPSKTIELNMDSSSGDGCVRDIQPHHSSQCGNCPHCGKIYSNQSALKYHVRLVHSDLTNMYCCHLCPESFDYREGYKKHMVEVHSIRNWWCNHFYII